MIAAVPEIQRGPMGNIVLRKTRHPFWKGDSASKKSGSGRARRWYVINGPCEECGKPATDRHHRDGNTLNNARSNLKALCRKCHMTIDGRLDRFIEHAKAPKPHSPLRPCENCKTPSKPLRKGRCHKCNEFFRRHGMEWTAESADKKGRRLPDRPCSNCQRMTLPGQWCKGRCPTCRIYLKQRGIERPSSLFGRAMFKRRK